MIKKSMMFVACALVMLMLNACGVFGWTMPEQIAQKEPNHAKDLGMKVAAPKTFAVYPFKNTSNDQCAALRARRAVQSEFSLLGVCKPLAVVDKLADKQIFTVNDVVKVGRELGVDAVIFGEVVKQSHYYHLFTVYTSVELKLWIYSTKTGKCIWYGENGDTTAHLDLGSGLFIQNTMHNYNWARNVEMLYHNTVSDMVHSIKPTLYYTLTKPLPEKSLKLE